MGELVDVDKARVVAVLFDGPRQVEGVAVSEIDAATGDADIAGQHGERVDKPDGKPPLQVALESKTSPDMHGMVGRDKVG